MVVDEGFNNFRIYCKELDYSHPVLLDFPVVQCSEYSDSRVPYIDDLKKTAWLLDPARRQIGFIRPGTDDHNKLIGNDK